MANPNDISDLWYCGFEPERFTPSGVFDGIVLGENENVFNALELYVRQMGEQGVTYRFGLFGPPSVGKTMTAMRVATALHRPFVSRAAGNFSGIQDVLDTHYGACGGSSDTHDVHIWGAEVQSAGTDLVLIHKPAVIFIDEAHMLNKEMQTILLSIMESPYRYACGQWVSDFRHVCFILATTDPSDLAKPLRTRLIESTFMPYSEDTISEIVGDKYPTLSWDDTDMIARAAKAIPRRALQMGQVLQFSDNVKEDLYKYFGADENGYDRTDSLIINYLKSQVGNLFKIREAELTLEAASRGEKVTQARLGKAQALLETTTPYKPVGIQAIAHALGYTDSEDIFARIMWLETKGILKRLPPRGVVYTGK